MRRPPGAESTNAPARTNDEQPLDRTIVGRMPSREFLEFEAIWPLRPFESFLDDCRTHLGAKEMKP